ncbi:metal-sensing transcriptional repressor [Halopseudomonas pelagia]|uniref:metal-sensing transcriptional repressor n=1 Tax=Halopseudomonas pelagia TaxID=553151 RepID=UPI00039CD1F4|nr:metal-sensing transcriptional repressor [Halopseudomonas pelagia]|tara:strand:+ start:2523 stop:2801 length:279 start_codon:yes stop_codon:yes gene_type:complete
MTGDHMHESHPDIIKRLKRAQGHLASVINMIDSGRPCLELAQQLHAVEKAIQQAKRVLVQDHIEHCLDAAIGPLESEQQSRIDEFKAIARYL